MVKIGEPSTAKESRDTPAGNTEARDQEREKMILLISRMINQQRLGGEEDRALMISLLQDWRGVRVNEVGDAEVEGPGGVAEEYAFGTTDPMDAGKEVVLLAGDLTTLEALDVGPTDLKTLPLTEVKRRIAAAERKKREAARQPRLLTPEEWEHVKTFGDLHRICRQYLPRFERQRREDEELLPAGLEKLNMEELMGFLREQRELRWEADAARRGIQLAWCDTCQKKRSTAHQCLRSAGGTPMIKKGIPVLRSQVMSSKDKGPGCVVKYEDILDVDTLQKRISGVTKQPVSVIIPTPDVQMSEAIVPVGEPRRGSKADSKEVEPTTRSTAGKSIPPTVVGRWINQKKQAVAAEEQGTPRPYESTGEGGTEKIMFTKVDDNYLSHILGTLSELAEEIHLCKGVLQQKRERRMSGEENREGEGNED